MNLITIIISVAIALFGIVYAMWARRKLLNHQQAFLFLEHSARVQEFEDAVQRVIEDEAGESFSMLRVTNAIADAVGGIIPNNVIALVTILPGGLLSFKALLSGNVSTSVIDGLKHVAHDSLALCNSVAKYDGFVHDEIIGIPTHDSAENFKIEYFIIPLFAGEIAIGVIVVAAKRPMPFLLLEVEGVYASVRRLMTSATRIERALTHDKQLDESRAKDYERRAYQSEVLRELNERVGYSLDLAKIIEIITGSVGRLLEYDVIAYLTRSNEKIHLKFDIAKQVNHLFVADIREKMINAYTAIIGEQILPDNIDESITGAIFDDSQEVPVNSFFNLPIVIGGNVAGMITVASSRPDIYTEEETAILYTITAQASSAVNKLNEVLEREKGKLNALVATLDDGIIMVDTHWDLLVINAKARSLLGLPDGHIGTFEVFDKLSSKIGIRTRIEKMFAQKTSIEPAEIEFDGAVLQVVMLPVSSVKGDTLGAVVIFHDITKERQERNVVEQEVVKRTMELRQEQSKLRASIDSLNIGFFMTDTTPEIIMMNPVARKILFPIKSDMVHEKEVSPGSPENISDVAEQSTIAELAKRSVGQYDFLGQITSAISENKVIEIKELELYHRIVRIFISPISGVEKTDERIGSVVLVEDITEQKVAERSKDEFFSIASHELRTPLTAIRGNISMINEVYRDTITDPEFKEMLSDIEVSSTRLNDVVHDFLGVSELEQGKTNFKKESFDLALTAEAALNEFKEDAQQRKILLNVHAITESKILALADESKVREVLRYLLSNAVRFTEKGAVTITINIESNGMVKVKVTDTGRGIPDENQILLFRKLQQAGDSILTRDTAKGTGLGLYISKLLVEGMDGTIYLESSATGVGSTFTFTLPHAK